MPLNRLEAHMDHFLEKQEKLIDQIINQSSPQKKEDILRELKFVEQVVGEYWENYWNNLEFGSPLLSIERIRKFIKDV